MRTYQLGNHLIDRTGKFNVIYKIVSFDEASICLLDLKKEYVGSYSYSFVENNCEDYNSIRDSFKKYYNEQNNS